MGLSPKLELRQGQQLALTRQLLQAIKLLQMPQGELAAFVEQEIDKNPLLEREDAGEDLPPSSNDNRHEEDNWLQVSEDAGEIAAHLDTDVENVFPEQDRDTGAAQDFTANESPYWQLAAQAENGFDDFGAETLSLQESLVRQLQLAEDDLQRRFIGQQLIEMVDDAGYITAPLGELSQRLNTGESEILSVLTILQEFDPPGICARDLKECLSLQLKQKDRFDPAMEKLVEHLDLVAKTDLVSLRRICGVDAEDLAEMILELRQLNPKPGAAFASAFSETLIPDVTVRRTRQGEWLVELNSEALPRVLLNEKYAAKIITASRTKDEKQYVSACLSTANWLVKALDQRAKTILKVASEIVAQQQGFLEKGVSELKPMLMRDIAAEISMHESTVSRVVTGKYMATPRGNFEFRYFFTTALASENGDAVSSESVRHQIRSLIENERPNNILSDDAIVDILKKRGITIARRTVAKYRDMMNIPTSAGRKRQKRVIA